MNGLEDVVHDLGRGQVRRSHAKDGGPLRFDAQRVQTFELRAVRRERPASVHRNPRDQIGKRQIDPDRHAITINRGAVVWIGERTAASRHDQVTHRLQELEDVTLRRAEVRLAVPCEDLGHAELRHPKRVIDVPEDPALPVVEEDVLDKWYCSRCVADVELKEAR